MEALDSRVSALLAEAAEWRMLSLLFEYPTERWRSDVAALARDMKDETLRRLAEDAQQYAAPGLHSALFGPAGSVPPREVTYAGGVQLGYLVAELSAYYEAFGYEPHVDEALDHVAVETGFVAFLKLKQACACAAAEQEHAAMAEEACTRFVKEHLATIGEPLLERLETFGPDYLVEAGKRLLKHAGPRSRNQYPLGMAEAAEDGDEITCGTAAAAELVQLEP